MASVVIAARQNQGRHHHPRGQAQETVLTAKECRIVDMKIRRQVVSALGVQWLEKRIIYDKKSICFSKVDCDDLMDFIPMHGDVA